MALLRRITLIVMSMAAVAAGVVVPTAPAVAASSTPTLISPANDTTTPLKDIILHWSAVPGASNYQVQVSPSTDWANDAISLPESGETSATVYEVPVSLPHATYFWRVRAEVGASAGPYSAAFEFLREWQAAITITHTPTATDPTLAWAPVPEASIYKVLFASAPVTLDDINTSAATCTTSATSIAPFATDLGGGASCAGPADGAANYWGVAAYDSSKDVVLQGSTSPLGGCAQLPECDATIATGGPFTPSPPSGTAPTGTAPTPPSALVTSWHAATSTATPCDTATPCPTTPTFSWNAVPGANFYKVSVYRDPAKTNIYREYSTEWTSFTPTDSFIDAQSGQAYYWDVSAGVCVSGGVVVSCNEATPIAQSCATSSSTSTTAPTVTGVTVNPAGPSGAQSMQGGATATVTLTGTNIQSGACVVASGGAITTAPSGSTTSLSFTYDAPASGGTVTFHIVNPDGSTSAESPPVTITSSVTTVGVSAISAFGKRSGPVVLTAPANGATVSGPAVTFHWGDYITDGSQGSMEAASYHVQVSTDDAFTSNVIDLATVDLTQYTDPSNKLSAGHYFWRVAAIDQDGNPLSWSAPNKLTVNSGGPRVHFTTPDGVGVLHALRIKFTDPVKGVNARTLRVVSVESGARVPGKLTLGNSPTQYVFTPSTPFATGGKYDLAVGSSIVDGNGNPAVVTGGPVRISTDAPNGSHGWSYSPGWHRFKASGAVSGSYVAASGGHGAKLRVAGSQARIYACKGPNMGAIRISIAGQSQTISEHQSYTRCGIRIWRGPIPSGLHMLKITVVNGTGNLDEVKVS